MILNILILRFVLKNPKKRPSGKKLEISNFTGKETKILNLLFLPTSWPSMQFVLFLELSMEKIHAVGERPKFVGSWHRLDHHLNEVPKIWRSLAEISSKSLLNMRDGWGFWILKYIRYHTMHQLWPPNINVCFYMCIMQFTVHVCRLVTQSIWHTHSRTHLCMQWLYTYIM